MKFLVDQPLGGLVKWLRLAGLDAGLVSLPAAQSALPAPAPETYLLTRREGLRRLNRDDLLVLDANAPEEQLAEVFRRLPLTRRDLAPLSRCGECNDLLTPVPREAALGLVPEHVYHSQAEFRRCPRCGRFYWPGSHPARIIAKLEQLLAGPPA